MGIGNKSSGEQDVLIGAPGEIHHDVSHLCVVTAEEGQDWHSEVEGRLTSRNTIQLIRGVSRIQRKGGLSPKGSGMFFF